MTGFGMGMFSRAQWLAAAAVIVATAVLILWQRPLKAFRFAITPTVVVGAVGSALLMANLAISQPPIVLAIAAVLLAALVGLVARAGELRRVRAMVARLAIPSERDRAREYLMAWAHAVRPRSRDRAALRWYPSIVCTTAGAMLAHNLTAEAVELLNLIPPRLPEARVATARATLLTMAHLSRGEHSEARSALDAAPQEIANPQSRQMLHAARALLDAVEGNADAALAALTGLESDPQLRGLVLAVEAHAHARLGHDDQAKAALNELREAGGAQALERIRSHAGPASSLVQV